MSQLANIFKKRFQRFQKGPTLLKNFRRVRPFQRGRRGFFKRGAAFWAAAGCLMLAGVGGTLALNGFFGGGAAIPEDTMTRGLAGYWSFDEGGGQTAFDASGNGNDGTLVNGPKWTQGKNGGALQFDGKDDYVKVGNNNIQGNENIISIETWFRIDQIKGYQWIVGKSPNSSGEKITYPLALSVDPSGNLQARLYDNIDCVYGGGVCYAQSQISVGEWYHVIATLDTSLPSENIKLYINGRLVKTGDYNGSQNSNTQPYIFGKYGSQYYLTNGQIDEVRIYNRALTEAEVRYHYNHGGPVAQWDMDEGSGSVINDKSGNGNNGTISGATWVQGKHGTALSFDGVDDYVDCGNASILSAPKELTVGAWFRANTVAPDQQIVGKQNFHDEYRLILYSNSLKGQIYDANTEYTVSSDNGGITIAAGNWYHGEMTYDGQILKLYVNGVQVDSLNLDIDINPNSLNLNIGKNSEECYFFNGQIDEVRIYDYARTEEEIRLDYNAGLAAHLGPSGKTCSEDPAGCMDYGLVGHWDMDEGGGSILNDKSGNNNHGTLTNGPQWAKGKNGSALQFDGKNDYVDCGNKPSLNITNAVTIEAWVKPDIHEAWHVPVSKGWAYHISIPSNQFNFYSIDSNGVAINIAISASSYNNKWTHLMMTIDPSANPQLIGYINGIKIGTAYNASYLGPRVDGNNLWIGDIPAAGRNFDGLIDEVRIYNRALSAEEVRYHYNHGGAVAQWDMDEGSGTKVYDSSGNNANADFPATADYQPRWSTP